MDGDSMAKMKFGRRISWTIVSSLVGAVGLAGCATEFDLRRNVPWEMGKDGKFESPTQVAAFWTEAVQNSADKEKGVRGFGGRLYFYGKNPNKPVKVKGSLVVYAFDETNRDPANIVPDRKYIFSADQFQTNYSKTDLGHSYSIWLPWDDVGGEQRQISLIARFTSNKGEIVSSDQSPHLLLSGVKPAKDAARRSTDCEIQSGQRAANPAAPIRELGEGLRRAAGELFAGGRTAGQGGAERRCSGRRDASSARNTTIGDGGVR